MRTCVQFGVRAHCFTSKLNARLCRGLALVVLLAGGWVASARATTWILTNGDRLTGELIESDEESLEILHPQLGHIRIARSAIRSTEATPEAIAPTTPKTTAEKPAVTVAVPATAGVVDTVASAEVKPLWKRQIEFGFVQQAGGTTSQTDLSFRAQVDGRSNADTYRATGKMIYSESGDKVLTDHRDADFRWRRDFAKRFFSQSLTTYLSDSVRDIDLNLEQQVGGGYRLIDEQRHKANVGLGAVVQYRKFEEITGQTALLGSFFEDYA
ncbi:MAG TPA: DUF481 domain-containing protein, partial [Candidatus Didemnitutus sp.]|nr:DUF481 domain-containing protein [Candidatus Didemnitutus sp.]